MQATSMTMQLSRRALPQSFCRPACQTFRRPLGSEAAALNEKLSWKTRASLRRPAPLLRAAAAEADQVTEATAAEASEEKVNWHEQWWPCAFLKDVDPKAPYPFTLLGEPIVIWRDGAGTWHAFRDACPHRLVPLSDGRVTPDGQLECPYHGWRFEGGGKCTAMPQGGDPSHPRSCATAYQCKDKQGLVWVKPQPPPFPSDPSASPGEDIPVLPELDDDAWFGFGDMFRDLPYDYATLMENVLDAGHVPFTHHGTVSRRQSSGLFDDMRVTDKGAWGFKGIWETGPRKGMLGAQSTSFQAPGLMRHTIDAYTTRGFANITAVYGVPTTPGRCRAFVRQPFKFKNRLLPRLLGLLPPFLGHLGNNDVLDDDVRFLHLQEEEEVKRGIAGKPIGKVFYMPGASDAYVVGFRNWLQRFADGGPFGPQNAQWLQVAGPRLPLSQLLDHYHSHTEKCETCRTALKRVRLLRVAAVVGAAVAGVAAAACAGMWWAVTQLPSFNSMVPAAGLPLLRHAALVCGLGAAVLLAIFRWCHKTIPRFYSGFYPPARNSVPGEWTP